MTSPTGTCSLSSLFLPPPDSSLGPLFIGERRANLLASSYFRSASSFASFSSSFSSSSAASAAAFPPPAAAPCPPLGAFVGGAHLERWKIETPRQRSTLTRPSSVRACVCVCLSAYCVRLLARHSPFAAQSSLLARRQAAVVGRKNNNNHCNWPAHRWPQAAAGRPASSPKESRAAPKAARARQAERASQKGHFSLPHKRKAASPPRLLGGGPARVFHCTELRVIPVPVAARPSCLCSGQSGPSAAAGLAQSSRAVQKSVAFEAHTLLLAAQHKLALKLAHTQRNRTERARKGRCRFFAAFCFLFAAFCCSLLSAVH